MRFKEFVKESSMSKGEKITKIMMQIKNYKDKIESYKKKAADDPKSDPGELGTKIHTIEVKIKEAEAKLNVIKDQK